MGCVQSALHRCVRVPSASWESIALFLICLVDTILTAFLVNTGMADEANPLMARVMEYGMPAFCIIKMLTVVPVLILAEWYRKRNPAFVRGALRMAITAYLCIYISSVAVINA